MWHVLRYFLQNDSFFEKSSDLNIHVGQWLRVTNIQLWILSEIIPVAWVAFVERVWSGENLCNHQIEVSQEITCTLGCLALFSLCVISRTLFVAPKSWLTACSGPKFGPRTARGRTLRPTAPFLPFGIYSCNIINTMKKLIKLNKNTISLNYLDTRIPHTAQPQCNLQDIAHCLQ